MPITIKYARSSKNYKPGMLDHFITNIPHPHLAASFIVINGKYFDVSKERQETQVNHDYYKINDAIFENKFEYIQKGPKILIINHKIKIGHTHHGKGRTSATPSINDIRTFFYAYLKYGSTFCVIVGRDYEANKITGKTIIEIPIKYEKTIKNKYGKMVGKQEWNTHWDCVDTLLKSQTKKGLLNKGLKITDKNKELNDVKNEYHKTYFQKLSQLFDLNIKIQEAPGYKFNKETMFFEKIE